jgi:hypothetical protein
MAEQTDALPLDEEYLALEKKYIDPVLTNLRSKVRQFAHGIPRDGPPPQLHVGLAWGDNLSVAF